MSQDSKKQGELVITQVIEPGKKLTSDQPGAFMDCEPETKVRPSVQNLVRGLYGVHDDRQAYLISLSGVDLGRVVPLKLDVTRVGRGSESDLPLDDDSVSRHHAEIVATQNGAYMVTDFKSTNGTFVEQERIVEHELSEGNKVIFGLNSVFKFVYQDGLDEELQQKLYDSVVRDSLTGVYNCKFIEQRIDRDLRYTKRHRLPFSLFLIDFDQFKKINEQHGHQTGDAVIIASTKAVSELLRKEDILGRFEGADLIIAAPGTNFSGAGSLAERIRKRIASLPIHSIAKHPRPVSVTVSIGVVTLDEDHETQRKELVISLIENVQKAKTAGANRIMCTQMFDD